MIALSRPSAPLALLLCLTLGLSSGCSSTRREPDANWRTTEVDAVSERILWTFVLNSLQRLGYPVGTGANPSELHVRTGWRTSLAPFRGQGQRALAEVRMRPVAHKRWLVEARVANQVNMALANPLDPRYAKWEWRPDDVSQADILLFTILASIQAPLEPRQSTDPRP